MTRALALLTFLVHDYNEAINFFTNALRFNLLEDTPLEGSKRWVVVAPPAGSASLLLARAATPEQQAAVGHQAGGRVFLFLHTRNFWEDYRYMQEHSVRFAEDPRQEAYGLVAVFYDLYGNKWDLLQPARG